MTTYPLSEPATIYAGGNDDDRDDIVGQGSLAECAEILEGLPAADRAATRIEMDALDLQFGPAEIDDLLRFLRNEDPGLSDQEIAALPEQDA